MTPENAEGPLPPPIMTRQQILKGALNVWGAGSQVSMAIEECAELIVALSHGFRGRSSYGEIAEEIADVRIMLDQIALIVGADLVAEAEERKLRRLEQRVRVTALVAASYKEDRG